MRGTSRNTALFWLAFAVLFVLMARESAHTRKARRGDIRRATALKRDTDARLHMLDQYRQARGGK